MVTLSELAVGGSVVVVATIAWAGLGLAHLGVYTLPATLGVATVALAMVVLAARPLPAVRIDLSLVLVLLLLGGLSVWLFFPGFPYAAGDKDPGVYVNHGFSIARTGSYDLTDPTLASDDVRVAMITPGARFPGVWVRDATSGTIVPQFYHLFPALLATGADLAGADGVFSTNPTLGVLSVLALTLAVTRAFGSTAGVLAGLLLATNGIQAWNARYPGSEVLTQLFVVTAILGLVIAIDTDWRPAAGAAGVLTGLTFLARPDGLLLVLLAIGIGCVAHVLRRTDARTWWFAGGLALTLPHGLYQAYVTAADYSRDNRVPGPLRVVGVVAALAIGTLVGRALWHRLRSWWAERGMAVSPERASRAVGIAISLLAAVAGAVLVLRPKLLPPHHTVARGELLRTYNELNLHRLAWFFTWPGIVLAWIGLVVTALGRWRAAAWAIVLPGAVLTPLYLWQSRVAPRLMWWTRRYVPVVVVIAVVLIAVAIAWALVGDRRGRVRPVARVAGGAAAAFVLASSLSFTWQILDHQEYRGSSDIARSVAMVSDRDAVVLWEPLQRGTLSAAYLFGSPVWLRYGHLSALLPTDATPADLQDYKRGWPDRTVLVVTEGPRLPDGLSRAPLRTQHRVQGRVELWEESPVELPTGTKHIDYDLVVWRLEGT